MEVDEKALGAIVLDPPQPQDLKVRRTAVVTNPGGNNTENGDHALGQEIFLDAEEIPTNWSPRKKWPPTLVVVLMTTQIGFCASMHTAAIDDVAVYFNCSNTVSTLGVTTFFIGFATGPLIFAPLSEVLGRNPVYNVTLFAFLVFNLGCALAPNVAALLMFRFLAAFFGSPTVTNAGGSITDMWAPHERSVPMALFTAASFLGPVIAPIVGGFVSQYTTWRWNYWIIVILASLILLSQLLLLPETYTTKLLQTKALRAGLPPTHQSLSDLYTATLRRPLIMLCTEPILLALSTYMALVFGILFIDFTAYPLIFTSTRAWSPATSGLAFLGIGLGMALATASSPYLNRLHAHYVAKLQDDNGNDGSGSGSGGGAVRHVVPEARLPHLVPLSWCIPAGLFWFGWTALPPTAWIWPILAGVPFGIGFVTLMLGIMSYLTDCYGRFAASALAANAVLRATFGATFPLFARGMYERLGTPWASSVLGFCSLAMAPMPWVFWRWGPWLRERSKFHRRMMEGGSG
ncbi:MFS general substrate transporter [Viridothelium virens]|uniref:MFS general substrate transporter n=1 Tax=Viridothelium virens TaxID=1048519 RepID=A0A6A6H390_VIRVR|nr:MFS general substrate transporter [Viridothelium virens]